MIKFKGMEDTGFEKPRREVAVQQSCAGYCNYDCGRACNSDCTFDCQTQCGGNPTTQSTVRSTYVASNRVEENSTIYSGIM